MVPHDGVPMPWISLTSVHVTIFEGFRLLIIERGDVVDLSSGLVALNMVYSGSAEV